MDTVWTVLVQYFICTYITILVTRAETHLATFPGNVVADINCTEKQIISIDEIKVQEVNTNCRKQENCAISEDIINSIKRNCSDKHACTIDVQSEACLKPHIYYNLTYVCNGMQNELTRTCIEATETIYLQCSHISHYNLSFETEINNCADINILTDQFKCSKQSNQLSCWLTFSGLFDAYKDCRNKLILEFSCTDKNVSCDFEKDTCNWMTLNTSLTWNLVDGYYFQPQINDHTTNSVLGKYMRIQAYYDGGTGTLVSSEITTIAPKCLSFWYYIQGEFIQSFEVYENTIRKSSISIDQQNTWNQHLVNLSDHEIYPVILKTTFEICTLCQNKVRFIIVDDILVTVGFCQDSLNYSITQDTTTGSSILPTSVSTGIDLSMSTTTVGTTAVSLNSSTTQGTATGSSISPTSVSTGIDLSMSTTTVGTTAGFPESVAKSSDTSKTTGIIVGVVVGIGFIVGLVIFLWCLVRRSKSVTKNSASHVNKMSSNDYTRHQSVALSTLRNSMSNNEGYTEIHTQNVNYQHVNSHQLTSINTSGRNYAELNQTKNNKDNKITDIMARNSLLANGATNHDYIYFDETDSLSTQTSINVQDVNMLSTEIHKCEEYAVVDSNNDHSIGNGKQIKCATAYTGNYAILDPHETGFFRSKGDNSINTDYDLAVPINDNECVSDLQDPYSVSDNGMYDYSGKLHHIEAETNIYSHAVENVYDMSSHARKIVENDGTYDHFFRDKAEDNYNITKID